MYNSEDIAIVRCNATERVSEIDVYLQKLKQEKLMRSHKQRLITMFGLLVSCSN